MWNSVTHIGDISGSGSVGGDRSFGFFSGILFRERILAHGSNGNVQSWKRLGNGRWEPEIPLTGHFNSVRGCSWDSSGKYLLTTSLDQTTRAFAPSKGTGSWHEVGRPQIHGYDLQCISTVPGGTFVSGADEKVLRVFSMPDAFKTRLAAIISGDESSDAAALRPTLQPALGLSNKQLSGADEADGSSSVAEMPLSRAPTESDLCRHTLWPEIDKLYGHGYELYSLAVSGSGDMIASAARANLAADAGIRFWIRPDAGSSTSVQWMAAPLGQLAGHSLTIVNLQFSPSGRYLLATSRDRTWSVTEISQSQDGKREFRMMQREEGHSRIIWSGAWISDVAFVTCSRDKTIKIWRRTGELFILDQTIAFDAGATAVAINYDSSIIAVGTEFGQLALLNLDCDSGKWSIRSTIHAASDSINDIKWHPFELKLAIVSADRSIRIYFA